MSKYTSSKYDANKGDLIPTVIVEFHNLPDYWLTKAHYDAEGKFKGALTSLEVSIREVKKKFITC